MPVVSLMRSEARVVAVTGAGGFIGRNLVWRLREAGYDVRILMRGCTQAEIAAALAHADTVFHLAAAIRPREPDEFDRSVRFTHALAAEIAKAGRCPLVVYSSSRRITTPGAFGSATKASEEALFQLDRRGEAVVAAYRLPNVFGKWARPNYNSCVATFCHNLARDLPIRIDDPNARLSLLYIDDLTEHWCGLLRRPTVESGFHEAGPVHETSVGEVASILSAFAGDRRLGRIGDMESHLERSLYATFVAALPESAFTYGLTAHTDPRGNFMEVFRTQAAGQFSVFTSGPGVIRGGHYHHSKVEKFLVVHGQARFRFRNISSDERFEVKVSAGEPTIVETIPGWTHDVTNGGEDMLVCLLWANEAFDPLRPDTYPCPV